MNRGVVHAAPNAGLFARGSVCAFLLFFFVFALFSPSIQYDLVHVDDTVYISNNTPIQNGLSKAGIRYAFSVRNTTATMYMPLLWISYMLDVEWFGATPDRPLGFHFTNVLLHALNAVLVFLLLLAFCRKPWRAFVFAAFWAIHPLRVESVAWVSERKDVLSGFFGLLCIGAYVWAYRRKNRRSQTAILYAASFLFFVLGLLAKPSLIPIPFILLALDFRPLCRMDPSLNSLWRTGPRLLLQKLPFLVTAGLAAYGAVAIHQVVSGEIPASLSERIQAVPLAYGFYLLKTIVPQNLTILYPHWTAWLTSTQAVAFSLSSALLLLWLSVAFWHSRRRAPEQLVGWLWFLFMLFPVAGIIPIPFNDVADRFSYLPAVGLSVTFLFLLSTDRFIHRSGSRLRPVLALSILAALSWLTLRQLPAWRNADTLNTRVLQVFPRHATALEIKAGNLMRATGDFEEADRLLTVALQADPHHWKALIAKAQCLWALEGPGAAQQFLMQMVPPTSRHTRSQWHRDLARYALMLGQTEEAVRHAEQSLSLLPPHDFARIPILFIAAAAAFEEGDTALALAYARPFPPYAQKTMVERPDLLPHYIFQWVAGYRRDTVDYFRRLLQAYPHRADYLNNLVWGLATAEWSSVDPQEVLEMAHRLAVMVPEPHPGLLDTIAAAQANAGDYEAAIHTMKKALSLLPPSDDPEVVLFKERLAFRLTLYEKHHPYREDAFLRLYVTTFGSMAQAAEPMKD